MFSEFFECFICSEEKLIFCVNNCKCVNKICTICLINIYISNKGKYICPYCKFVELYDDEYIFNIIQQNSKIYDKILLKK